MDKKSRREGGWEPARIRGGDRAQRQAHKRQAEDMGICADMSLGNGSRGRLELERIEEHLQ